MSSYKMCFNPVPKQMSADRGQTLIIVIPTGHHLMKEICEGQSRDLINHILS